jgi:hypothetical protein
MIDLAADDNGSDCVIIAPTTTDVPPTEAVPAAGHHGGGYSDADYRIRVEAEIREELPHPDDVFITEAQYKLDRECAEFAARAHLEGKTVDLQVAKTAFYLSSFHFKDSNHSMTLYTDPSAGARRQEWVDFVRRRNDGYVLHLWDQRIAIMLTLKNSATNTFQLRFFVAMTNLYMQMGGGKVHKELVLLDILVRMDVHSHVDALVGVIATGEVRLWKHSKDHLRFLHCDFMNEVERGENFWIAVRPHPCPPLIATDQLEMIGTHEHSHYGFQIATTEMYQLSVVKHYYHQSGPLYYLDPSFLIRLRQISL